MRYVGCIATYLKPLTNSLGQFTLVFDYQNLHIFGGRVALTRYSTLL